jgi:hypothetical protein
VARNASDRGRLAAVLTVLAAAAVLTGCAAEPAQVQVAAATRSAGPSSWFLESGGVVPTPAPATVDLSPVIPRPYMPDFVPPVVPRGRPVEENPPPAACGGYANPVRINPGAVPGAGSATISWQADQRPEVTGYRVQAVVQTIVTGTQPRPLQQSVAQPAGCVPVTTTVTGLTRGESYVFWLEEAVTDPTSGVTRLVQVGTSAPVVIG